MLIANVNHIIFTSRQERDAKKFAEMIVQVKANIKAEKEQLKTINESFTL